VEHIIMQFSIYAMLMSSYLALTIADRVPKFDVGPSCRQSTIPDCQNMEKIARDKLIKDWPNFTAQDRAMCTMEEKMSGPPSYVGWLTCLEINANARSPEARGADNATSAAATGRQVKPKKDSRIRSRQ